MPGLSKVAFNKTVLFVTTSFEEGILLPANPLMKLLFYSALARAQHLYPVRICHLVVEGSHVHFIIIVDNPKDVADFMGRFKTETAHYINRLLGRKKRTVWCDGYDSPTVLKKAGVMKEITYTYINPAKDSLEDSISKYPGANSWKGFQSGTYTKRVPWIRRSMVPKIPKGPLPLKWYENMANQLKRKAKEWHTLTVSPDAWMECFDITDKEERKKINQTITQRVERIEAAYKKRREKAGKSVIGAARLRRQNLDLSYVPKRSGKRMWCLCSDIPLRKAFIMYVKSLVEQAKEVQKRWQMGDFSVPYPLGLYPPSMPRLAEPMGYRQFI